MISRIITKIVFEVGVASAVINFNVGMSGFEKLLSHLSLSFGVKSSGAIEKDKQRTKI